MSKLLLDEPSLQVQPSLAKALGSLDEAVIIQQLHYWLQRTNNVQTDGNKWIYNSMNKWLEQFPWIGSRSKLARCFDDLEEKGLIVTGNFNKAKFDKTKWYRIDYNAFSDFEQRLIQNESTNDSKRDNGVSQDESTSDPKRDNGMTQNEATYTNRLPETTTENTQETTARNASAADARGENPFDLIHEHHINANEGDHLAIFLKAIDDLGNPLVCWAIHQTVDGPAPHSWKYLKSIFDRLRNDGISSVVQADKGAQRHNNRQSYKSKVPEDPWNKDYTPPKGFDR